MIKFKVGDKVVMVRQDIAEEHRAPPVEFPSVGVVESVLWYSVMVEGSNYFWPAESLELLKE